MRSVESLIKTGPVETRQAIRITIAACKAVRLVRRSALVQTSHIIVLTPDNVSIKHSTRLAYSFSHLWHSLRLLIWKLRKPTIVITRNEIAWDAMNVFAFGSMLWSMLAGKHLPLSTHDSIDLSDLAPELQKIIGKALSRNIEERYKSPEDLANALATHLADPVSI